MKIGISIKLRQGGYDRFGDEKYSKIKAYGFDCVDWDMCNTAHALYSLTAQDLQAYLKREKALAQQAGIEISQTHGPWHAPIKDAEEADRLEKLRKTETAIIATKLLGCKYLVMHPLLPCGADDTKKGLQNKTWEINVSFFTRLLEIAKANDITICLENTPFVDFSLACPLQILKLVRSFRDDHLKMCLDTGHVAVLNHITVGEAIRQAADEIRVLHVHDNNGKADQHLPPFQGVIDWQDFSCALKEIHFNGAVSLEIVPNESLPTEEFELQSRKLADIARSLAT